ncbi:MAG TPA: hypothetical protein PKI94_05380, partial [Candidatus Gastranaerophilaceae bacterium]|nr:hypothetical protein [Candidatus Gastranaerophilaceae bacterium]
MKKDFNKSKYGLSVGVALLLSQFAAFGGDLFDNNLLKVDLNKTSPAGVKVTLYTKNPYKEALTVNKKSDFQYVILLPETVSSITSKPSLSATSDVIQNIEVKTQQLSQEASKGYTKIIISTTKPIEIVAQNQVLSTSDYKVSESDYKELIAQAGKKSVAQKSAVSAAKKAEPVKKATTPAKKSTVQPAKTAKPVIKKQAIPVAKPKPKVAAPAVQKPVNKPPVQKSVEQKPVVQPAKNIPATTPAPVTTTAPAPQPQTAPATTPTAEQALPAAQPIPAMPQKVEMPLPETPFQKVMNIIKANLTMFAGGALLIPLILLLIFMKKGKKPVAEIKEEKTQVQETSEGMPNIQQLQEEVVEEEVIEEGLTEDELPETEEIIFPQEEIITDKKEEIDTLFNQDTANDILTKEHQKQAEDVEENTEREPVIETVPETSSPAEESFEEILPLEDIIPLENIEPIDEIEQMEGAVAPEPESELESETETETET